jgi:hypothetical protein
MTHVPVTEDERRTPYYKYFERDMAAVPREKYEMINTNPLRPEDALKVQDMNDLFKKGYLPGEFGCCVLTDGTFTVANYLKMPGVTVDMFDWWFAWHGLEPIRYKIWDKEDHHYCLTRNPEQARDRSLSMKERYWNTIHDIRESSEPGGEIRSINIQFRNPVDIGFSPELLARFDGTIVCSGDESHPVIMCHFVRPIEDGIELRTRFWMGYCVVDKKPVKALPGRLNLSIDRAEKNLRHNIKEFSNLAAILPEVYAEFKDSF